MDGFQNSFRPLATDDKAFRFRNRFALDEERIVSHLADGVEISTL